MRRSRFSESQIIGMLKEQEAGTALRELMIPHHLQRRLPPRHRCRQGFPKRSFKNVLSSIASASSRFSFRFSSSSCRNRRASDTSSPPNLAFSL